jgi:hypothetical protein
MNTSLLGVLGISALTIAAACTTTDQPPPDGSVSEFCADYAKAICQISSSCQFDPMACATFQTGQCMTNVTSLETGTRQYNQPNGKACIDALSGAYGGSPNTISAANLAMIATTCNKIVVGDQVSDKPCTGDNDCSGDLVCAAYGQTFVCAPITQRNLGDPCADPGDQCQGDSYCAAQSGVAPQCVATAATGGSCSASIPCGTSDRCLAGVCTARAGIGDTCATNADCSPTAPYCDTFPPAVCTTGLSFARGSTDCQGILGTDEPTTGDDGGGLPAEAGSSGAGLGEAGE